MTNGINKVDSMLVRAVHNTKIQMYSQNSCWSRDLSFFSFSGDESESHRLISNIVNAKDIPSIVGDASWNRDIGVSSKTSVSALGVRMLKANVNIPNAVATTNARVSS